MIKYETARSDFEYLETLRELYDQVDLDSRREELMQTPTKAKAAELYCSAVGLWLAEQGDLFADNPRVLKIFTLYRSKGHV